MATKQANAIFGNLLYYPDKPQSLIFFETLSDKDGYNQSRGEDYARLARQIYNQGLEYLTNNHLTGQGWLKKGSDEYNQKIKAIVDFLTKAQQYEKKNQLRYFKAKKDLIYKNFTRQEIEQATINEGRYNPLKELVDFLEDNSNDIQHFDYDYFIVLINSLLQGRNFTIETINYERERLQLVKQATNEAAEALVNEMKKQNQIQYLQEYKQIAYSHMAKQKIKAQYLQKKKFTNLVMSDDSTLNSKITTKILPTIDMKMAKFINSAVNYVWNSEQFSKKIKQDIQQYYPQGKTITSEQIKKTLTNSVLNYCADHMHEAITSAYSEQELIKVANDIDTRLQRSFQSAQLNVTNIPNGNWWTSEIAYFDDKMQKYTDASGLFAAINKFYKQSQKEGIKNLTKEKRETYVALGLNKGAEREAIIFINKLQQFCNRLQKEVEKYPQTPQQIKKQFSIKGKKTDQFTFKVNKNGNVIITQEFIDFFMGLASKPALLKTTLKEGNTLAGTISAMKKNMTNIFKEKLDSLRQDELSKQLLDKIEKNLKEVKMNISGPDISQLIATLQLRFRGEELLLYFPGHQNNKNDSITFSMDYDSTHLEKELSNILRDVATDEITKVTKNIIDEKKAAVLEFQKSFSAAMEKMKKDSEGRNNPWGYHNYKEKANAFLRASQTYNEQMKKSLEQLEELYQQSQQLSSSKTDTQERNKIREKYMNIKKSIEDTLYRSDTMKTYTEYQDNIGFVGGSIGTNLAMQLDSIAQMFEQAGQKIDDDDLKLLHDLIINTNRHSIIKYRYRRPIETYLGALAAFMLFDEGGAEVQILADNIQDTELKGTQTPDILHLYRLNGIYYPGSYILQQTLFGVQDLNTALSKLPQNSGATIMINNTITMEDIPGVAPDSWQAVANAATKNEGKTNIHITFMAGMINILHNLQKCMSNIVVPKNR